MRMISLVVAIIVLWSGSGLTQGAGIIGVYADPGGLNCNVTDSTPGLLPIFIVHTLTPGAISARFSAPMPSCMIGATHLSDTPVFAVTTGDSQTGVFVGYGLCLSAPIHILTINYFAMGTTTLCCPYPILGDPRASTPCGIEVEDCNSNVLAGMGRVNTVNGSVARCCCSYGLHVVPTVSNPSPPDSAVDQPITTKLGWESEWTGHCGATLSHNVYFGTDSLPSRVALNLISTTYDPGRLATSTTYFWRVVMNPLGSPFTISTPVWRFTTDDVPTPVEKKTWGAIKALYMN